MIKNIEDRATEFCVKGNHRYTVPRKEVLKIIASQKKPIKAYEILKKLGKVLKNPKPPTAYRAIEFWLKHNFIHRIESLNAFTICEAEHLHEGSQFMICNACGTVIESHICELPRILKKSIDKNTFKLTKWNIEINGVCNQCS